MSVNINKIKNELIKKYKFLGGIIDNTNYFETPNCIFNGMPTGETDGITIFYHPDIDKYTEKQQQFLFAHEICHIALNHINRCGNRDKKIWNRATDAVINAHLKNDGLELIDGAIDMPWARKYDAEKVYEILLKKEKKQQRKNKSNKTSNSSDNSSENEQIGHDNHSLWDDILSQNIINDEDNIISEKIFFDKNIDEIEKKKLLNKIEETIVSKLPGNSTNSKEFKLDKIDTLYPIINWPLYLTRPIEIVELDWTYQNASIEDGVVQANLEESSYSLKYKIEILMDTSESVKDEILRQFLKECKNLLKFSEIKVGCFDTKFYGFNEIRSIQDIDNMTFIGRGGTNFSIAVNAFSNDADIKIIFTDGNADMPNKEMDIIWVVYGNTKIEPKGGKVIYVDENELINMSNLNLELNEKEHRLIKGRRF